MVAGWHPAISFALLGRVPDGLTDPPEPDLDALLIELEARAPDEMAVLRHPASPPGWPYAVPADLRPGLGYAQLAALIEDARRRLRGDGPPRQVIASRPLTEQERRWAADVPPHHGS